LSHPEAKYRQILGIRFFTGSAAEAVQIALRGGLVVVPAAPALVEIDRDQTYREALLNSDLALTDSGFMVLLWNAFERDRVTRVSGLEYIKHLIAQPLGKTLWVMPSENSCDRAISWLQSRGLPMTTNNCYFAPIYNRERIVDQTLLNRIVSEHPNHVIIALAGGVQEKLGHYLKQNAGYTPGIHCIGAAIGFLSGDQVNIPDWADRLFLGWLFRCCSQPAKFFPRYWKARRLLPLLFKYRERLPVAQAA
jgi:UDP-N-acetyl-D-mannosaminuronic acid transferase (WecB/TagA/CpsF family)